jgi:hypothetical protein
MINNFKKVIFLAILGALIFFLYLFLSPKKAGPPQETPTASKQPIQLEKKEVAEAEKATVIPAEKIETAEPKIPEKYILDIPFYSQAPFGNWDKVHEEMCEEASLLNAGLYLLGKKLSKEDFESELGKMRKIEKRMFNDYESTTVAETKKFADEYFQERLQMKIIENPTIESIEAEIAADHPVVVPLAGRDIGNPNFTPPGPVYHMLVVKGYDASSFITNDVGTRKGNSYVYKKEVIMKSIHDWDKTDIRHGAKRVLVLYK